MLRIEDICITVIERLIRQGYLEWKRKPDGKTEEEMEAKLDKHVILEKDVTHSLSGRNRSPTSSWRWQHRRTDVQQHSSPADGLYASSYL